MIRKSLYIDEQDVYYIKLIREKYGCVSESQAMRLALKALGTDKTRITLPEISKHARRSPKD